MKGGCVLRKLKIGRRLLRRAAALLAAAALCAGVSGCAFLDTEYYSSTSHKSAGASQETGAAPLEASDYKSLREAVVSLVNGHLERAKIKLDSYSGDPEADVQKVCAEVSTETALGSYAVYYINSSLNKIVSYYEADITISYKKSRSEIADVVPITGETDLSAVLADAAGRHAISAAVQTENAAVNADMFASVLASLYYASPEKMTYLPKCTVTVYPKEGVGGKRILEAALEYPYSALVARERAEALAQRAADILKKMGSLKGREAVEYLCTLLSSITEYDEAGAKADEYDRWNSTYTAYGALVLGKAAGEGYAMALKYLCDRLGIGCTVVRGRFKGVTYAWDIVALDNGSSYHVDPASCQTGVAFRNDSEMPEEYWWDQKLYEPCDGPSLAEEKPPEGEGGASSGASSGEMSSAAASGASGASSGS